MEVVGKGSRKMSLEAAVDAEHLGRSREYLSDYSESPESSADENDDEESFYVSSDGDYEELKEFEEEGLCLNERNNFYKQFHEVYNVSGEGTWNWYNVSLDAKLPTWRLRGIDTLFDSINLSLE
jgi:hypothetical protein